MIQPALAADVSVKIDMTKMVRMSIHIERLILDGLPVDRSDGPAVKAAVEEELSKLIADRGISFEFITGGAVALISANDIRFGPGASPSNLGTQIARSVYGRMG